MKMQGLKFMNDHFVKLVSLLLMLVVVLQGFHLMFLFKLQKKHPDVFNLFIDNIFQKPNNSLRFRSYVAEIQNAHIMDQSGTYMIVPNIGSVENRQKNDTRNLVTLCTQTTSNHLHFLGNLSSDWNGPLSVTVFTSGEDAGTSLYSIIFLQSCYKKVNKNVLFHMAFPISDPPRNLEDLLAVEIICDKENKISNLFPKRQNYADVRHEYPHNVLRNIAITNAATPYIFVVDIDMVPSKDLFQHFTNFIQRRLKASNQNEKSGETEKQAYIVASFESRSLNVRPMSKKELTEEWNQKSIQPFYRDMCWKCQRWTDYDQWRNLPSFQFLDIGYDISWQDPYEPFYIAKKKDLPLYDGRFKQYGFNRISQICEMHIAGFKFSVLNNAFIIHRGFKVENEFHEKKKIENESNKILFRNFKVELKERYPESKQEC